MSWPRRVIGALAALSLASSCSSADEPSGAAGTTVPAGTVGAVDSTAPATTTSGPTTAPPTEGDSGGSVAEPVTPPTTSPSPAPASSPPAVPVSDPPQTGVPGFEADTVCRSVGTLLVTEYLVGLVEAFGTEVEARQVEAAAAPALLASLAELEVAVVPAGLGQDPVAARWAGLRARATTATSVADLAGAGLLARWLEILATHDRNDPEVVLGLDPAQAETVERAAAAIGERHGPIATDPDHLAGALVTTPAIDAHVASRCPEVAVFGTGDAV